MNPLICTAFVPFNLFYKTKRSKKGLYSTKLAYVKTSFYRLSVTIA